MVKQSAQGFDVIGDIHGCYDEFVLLTKELGYQWNTDIPLHPEGRKLVFLGDLTDRGKNSLAVIDTVSKLVSKKAAFYCPGNHCNKLYRFFKGNKVQITHGLETTVAEYRSISKDKQSLVREQFMKLYEKAPLYLVLNKGKLVVAHAGIREKDIGKHSHDVKTFVLYGDITGEVHPNGSPVRRDWAQHYEGKATIVYGHTPVKNVRKVNNTYNIDTGVVFGGALTAFRYPQYETISIPSSMPYVEEKFSTFS
ncbi:bis(5'-nucleosyl)-tetraphosphatase PrpE [Priestia endophytica]|jgi:protein phosphatase|uniref:bis(5'-nucleosyl)-tetraphosphatase PrpE n=1 Tax=Priestia endophytica TaxID=135735 RepID=UPI002E1A2A4F|nr:bis(5'-nucleosyl)-tetraphosphatase PrpE [Priestia endophytica]